MRKLDSGRITLDGVDINALDTQWLREQIAFVPQEPVMFSGSVLWNLCLGNNNAHMLSRKEIVNACQLVNAHSFIENLENVRKVLKYLY